jgi:hypothetical protein
MMIKSAISSAFLIAVFVAGLAIAPAHAQASRTWISGVGDDANPCSRTAPCKTFAGAISKTLAGGEIDVLDPGGFGGITINKAITFDGGGGQVASILTAGTPGATIAAGGSDVVILRNLRFNGLSQTAMPGTIGVSILSAGKVVIEKCEIFGWSTNGVAVTPSAGTLYLKIQETTINNSNGALLLKPTGGAVVNASVERAHLDGNVGGLKVDGTGGGSSNVAITDTTQSLNSANGMNVVSGPSGNVNADVMRGVFANNTLSGVVANNTSGGTATVTVGNSILSYNGVGAWSIVNTGTLLSFKNNQVTGPTGSTPGQANFQ